MTDDELYNRFLEGDSASYDELLIRLGDGLIVYINGYLHNWQDSEDLTIEAFSRISVKRPVIRGGFRAYLYKTARNLASRFHTMGSRTEVFSLDSMNEEASDGILIEERVIDSERKRALYRCLERIDPELREALWLIYFEGLSYAEAAEVMKVTNRRINHLLSRGKESMRRELEKEGITDI